MLCSLLGGARVDCEAARVLSPCDAAPAWVRRGGDIVAVASGVRGFVAVA